MSPVKLASLAGGLWQEWEAEVKAGLPNFARSPFYVDQISQSEQEYKDVAQTVQGLGPLDEPGKARDAEFGGRLVQTCLGKVTRMWLDSNIEMHFLLRHLPNLKQMRVLDIGAGYGRLAVSLAPFCSTYTCVDAVRISTVVCTYYCHRFRPKVEVLPLDIFSGSYLYRKYELAVNTHSWNECTLAQVENWLEVLVEMKVPYLFTVSHGQSGSTTERAYYTWDPSRPSFRPAIERGYDLVAEESIGMSNHPHALWRLKRGT